MTFVKKPLLSSLLVAFAPGIILADQTFDFFRQSVGL
jgi:hypothetical protein